MSYTWSIVMAVEEQPSHRISTTSFQGGLRQTIRPPAAYITRRWLETNSFPNRQCSSLVSGPWHLIIVSSYLTYYCDMKTLRWMVSHLTLALQALMETKRPKHLRHGHFHTQSNSTVNPAIQESCSRTLLEIYGMSHWTTRPLFGFFVPLWRTHQLWRVSLLAWIHYLALTRGISILQYSE